MHYKTEKDTKNNVFYFKIAQNSLIVGDLVKFMHYKREKETKKIVFCLKIA